MKRPLSILLVLWSLVATPVLCRAGVRLGCCAAPIRLATVDHIDDCAATHCAPSDGAADSRTDDEDSQSRDVPGGGSCAGVCSPVARPLDQAGAADLIPACQPLLACILAPDASIEFSQSAGPDRRPCAPALPFAQSDIPLLI